MNKPRVLLLFAMLAMVVVVIVSVFGFEPAAEANVGSILIDAVYYDGQLRSEPDEAIRLVNVGATAVDLTGWRLNDSVNRQHESNVSAGSQPKCRRDPLDCKVWRCFLDSLWLSTRFRDH